MSKKRKFLIVLIISFVVSALIRTFIVEGFYVSGDSMYPTIKNGEYVFVNKAAFWFRDPSRGEIIVAIPRTYPGRVIKRIIGMPGERLSIENKKIIIRYNRQDEGNLLDESYIGEANTPEVGITRIIIDPKEYFAMGDNRAVSIDSRELGPIDLWSIKGKAFATINFHTWKYTNL